MTTSSFRAVFLPYCLQRQADGRYAVLNRQYEPVGFFTSDHVAYEAYPILVKIKGLTARKAAAISPKGSSDLEAIYLYNDGCIPTKSQKNMQAYLARIERLAKLTVSG